MRVIVRPADRGGCGFYRMTEPARAVVEADLGLEVEVSCNLTFDSTLAGVTHLDAGAADVVVFQRPVHPGIVSRLQAQGVAVVVEVDDLFSAVPAEHLAAEVITRRRIAERVAACAALADWVTVSTPALLAVYAAHGRGSVVPNAMPRRLVELPPAYERTPDPVVVGWTGVQRHHPHDLDQIGPGLTRALHATGARFTVIGRADTAADVLGLDSEPHIVPGIADVEQFVTAVGERLDVGIAPLHSSRFNDAKSWLKPLEYAARGVLPVWSPTPEYRRLDLGVPAGAPHEWAQAITRAVIDDDYRRAAAAVNHQRVLAAHLTEHTAEAWACAWSSAADRAARTRRGCA